MTANTKSLILLAVTLVVGFTLGLFADATLVRARRDRIAEMRRPPGLVAHLEQVIEPRAGTQADTVHAILQSFAQRNAETMREANERLRVRMDSLHLLLDPVLDADQQARLKEELSRMPPANFRPGGRRGGPPGGPRGGPPPLD